MFLYFRLREHAGRLSTLCDGEMDNYSFVVLCAPALLFYRRLI
jgi:hypothetical protein